MITSHLGRTMKKAASLDVPLALDILECWRAGLSLSKLVSDPSSSRSTVDAAKFSINFLSSPFASSTSLSNSKKEGGLSSPDLDIASKTPNQVSKMFGSSGVVYCSSPLFSASEISDFKCNARSGLSSLIDDHLTPRNLTLDDEFDFDEVRGGLGGSFLAYNENRKTLVSLVIFFEVFHLLVR